MHPKGGTTSDRTGGYPAGGYQQISRAWKSLLQNVTELAMVDEIRARIESRKKTMGDMMLSRSERSVG
jgi:hypothetical protein